MPSNLLAALPLVVLSWAPAPVTPCAVERTPPCVCAASTAVDPVGTWTMTTVLNDQPGTMKLVVTREKSALVADVTTLMGATVRARAVTFKNDHLTVEAEAHEGMVLTLEIDFRGNELTGKWHAGEYNGELKGRREEPRK